MCNANIPYQRLWAAILTVHRMTFYLSGNVVALCLDYGTVKSYVIKVA